MLARVLAMVLCQSSIETAKRVGLVFGMGASFYPTLYCKEIRVPPKIGVLPSGSLLEILDLENFATSYRSSNVLST